MTGRSNVPTSNRELPAGVRRRKKTRNTSLSIVPNPKKEAVGGNGATDISQMRSVFSKRLKQGGNTLIRPWAYAQGLF